jgi:hypothetical protein
MFDICGNNLTLIKMVIISTKFIRNIGIIFILFFIFPCDTHQWVSWGRKNQNEMPFGTCVSFSEMP